MTVRGSSVVGFGVALLLAILAAGWTSSAAAAAPTWQAPVTVANVRGIPKPSVAVDRTGKATLVYSDSPPGATTDRPTVYATVRPPAGEFGRPNAVGNGVEPRIAVSPDGTTAIAWIDGDRIQVLRQPGPGLPGTAGQLRRSIDVRGTGARSLRLVLDGGGRATLAWLPDTASDAPAEVQPRVATVAADGGVGAVQALGPPAACARLQLIGNAAGDAAAACFPGTLIHSRAVGQDAFATETYAPHHLHSQGYLGLDGAGTVTVALPANPSGAAILLYAERPRGGAFGPLANIRPGSDGSVPRLFSQEARSVVAWVEGRQLRYSIRPAGGRFGPTRTLPSAGRSLAAAFADVTAPLGPLPLLTSRQGADLGLPDRAPLDLQGGLVAADGAPRAAGAVTVPGLVDFPGNVAGSESGVAVATWEQRCGTGFAVMAMALDERRGTSQPPCQDTAAPKVLVRPRHARLDGRRLRVRVGCNEACRVGLRVRVLRGNRGRPLATGTLRTQSIGAARYRRLTVRLRPRQAARVRAVLAARGRVTVRLAMPVRDSYENGAVRRVAVPLRR